MTPQEKAQDIFYKMLKHSFSDENESALYRAKQCALIAVDEILNNFGLLSESYIFYTNSDTRSFYEEVKQEIEKL